MLRRLGSQSRSLKVIYFATRSGGITFDTGEGGGNPFASALIELAADPALTLPALASRLQRLTAQKSPGRQIPEYVGPTHLPKWRFQRKIRERPEKRSALVLVVFDYSDVDSDYFGASSWLPGAYRDERRISAALAKHGFSVTQGVRPDRKALSLALSSFKRQSRHSDVSVIYSTGHGFEVDGKVYLLPGDYPIRLGFSRPQLNRHAVSVAKIVRAASARKLNLVFFAGCRSFPPDLLAPPKKPLETDRTLQADHARLRDFTTTKSAERLDADNVNKPRSSPKLRA
jgi:hypothetical protein